MKERWLRIGSLAGAVFLVAVVGRVALRIASVDDPDTEADVTLLIFAATGLLLAVVAIWWGRVRRMGVVLADLAAGLVIGGALNLAVGPFVSGTSPAEVGVGDTFNAAWQFVVFAGGGGLVGLLLLIMVGKDYKSRSLKQFAESKLTKPHRPVRR